jgi:hypothetical protein
MADKMTNLTLTDGNTTRIYNVSEGIAARAQSEIKSGILTPADVQMELDWQESRGSKDVRLASSVSRNTDGSVLQKNYSNNTAALTYMNGGKKVTNVYEVGDKDLLRMLGEETATLGMHTKLSPEALQGVTGQALNNAIQGMTTLGFGVKLMSAAVDKLDNAGQTASGPNRTADTKARQSMTPSTQRQKPRAPGMAP